MQLCQEGNVFHTINKHKALKIDNILSYFSTFFFHKLISFYYFVTTRRCMSDNDFVNE